MAKLEEISIAGVGIPDRHRQTTPAKVKDIAESVARIGLLSPIGVTKGYDLIFGRHRLEACESLGWTKIAAFRYDSDDITNEIAEHAENLCREEYTALERAKALARMKELYEAQYGADSKGGRPKSAEKTGTKTDDKLSSVSATEAIAEQTGVTQRTVQRDISIGEAIPDDVAQTLAGTPTADNQAELARLAKLTAAQQRKAAKRIKSGKAKTVTEAAGTPTREEEINKRYSQKKTGRGEPTADVRMFKELADEVGKLTRMNTALMKHCGGKEHHETIRTHLNAILMELKQWQQKSKAA